MKTIFITICFLLAALVGFSQEKTKIRGRITDAQTGEPMSYVSVAFKKTSIGTVTDANGEYFLETRAVVDTVVFTFMGYKTKKVGVKKRTFQTLNIVLEPSDYATKEVKVVAERYPEVGLFKKIVAHKKQNNPQRYQSYNYEAYNKMEFDVSNIDEKFKKKRVFKQFQFIFDYIDTSVVSGKSYLPVFLTETLSDVYFQRSPERKKEVIKANKISGIEDESVSQFTGQMYVDVNIYDNFIRILGKEFTSPLSDLGLLSYKYYLLDSAFMDGYWCYHMSFKPRRKQELTFTGEFWIHDTTFAVKKVKARMSGDANINFVNDFIVNQEYTRVDNKCWFINKDEVFVEFNVRDKGTGIFGHKTTTYKNVKIEPKLDKDFFSNTEYLQTVTEKDALKKDAVFWEQARHEELSQKEINIYGMVDSIKNVPVFRTFVDIVTIFVSGYYVKNYFEYGPYFTLASYNQVEGYRVRLGGRTSNKFSETLMLTGHMAYGFKDERLKGALGATYVFQRKPRVQLTVSGKHDVEQLGQSRNAFMSDNILSSVLQRNPQYKLSMVDEAKVEFRKDWFVGLSNSIKLRHRSVFSSDSIRLVDKNANTLNKVTSAEVTFNTRFIYNEKVIEGVFEQKSVGSVYPVVDLDLTAGLNGILGAKHEYYKAELNIDHFFDINPIGWFRYQIQGGKIFGKNLPYPLLRLHEGNETYGFDRYAYNMMNYYEFISDTYASLYAEHHFEGLFLNKVPLFRKLKWREVICAKGLIGRLSDDNNPAKNSNAILFPYSTTTNFKKPYYEAGFGIENIFKILRIDAVWRLSYLDNPNIQKFGLRAKLQVTF